MTQANTKLAGGVRADIGKYARIILPYLGLVLMLLVFAVLTGGQSIRVKNLLLILDQSYVLLTATTGVFFVMTIGGLDFSQGSIVGVAGIVVAYVARFNIPLAILAGIVTGGIIGLMNGSFNVFGQIPSFIVTICTMFLFRGLCKYLTTDSPVNAPLALGMLDKPSVKLPIVLCVLAAGWFIFRYTTIGTKVKAVGAGELAAHYSGIHVKRIKLTIFTLAGCLAGLAAFLNVIKVGSITATGGNLIETNILVALVLGGMPIQGGAKARFQSVIVGCLLYAIMNNGLVMLKLEPTVQQLITGLIFLLVVAFSRDRKSNLVVK